MKLVHSCLFAPPKCICRERGEACDEERALINDGPNTDKRWPQIWLAMWDAGKDRISLKKVGRQWLELPSSPPLEVWSAIWAKLWDDSPGDRGIQPIGQQWIETTSVKHPGWPSVWLRLAERSGYDEALFDLGHTCAIPPFHNALQTDGHSPRLLKRGSHLRASPTIFARLSGSSLSLSDFQSSSHTDGHLL